MLAKKNNKNKLIVILGPTASGKSSLALDLAKQFNGYIISADSRQIYKEMDIATNKEKGEWRNGVFFVESIEHYLIDIINPDAKFSAAQFQKEVYKIISKKKKENPRSIPFLVGGTGLYISSIVDNLQFPKAVENKKIRLEIEKEMQEKGLEFVYEKLIKSDPLAKDFVAKDNPRRVLRAMEVFLLTNKSLFLQQNKKDCKYDVLQIGLKIDREKLYEKINKRVDQMIEQGLVEEVKRLVEKGYDWNLESMSGIGYKQIGMHLRGEIDLAQAIELIKKDTRHYAKRQETWFKRDKRIQWIENKTEAERLIKNFLK